MSIQSGLEGAQQAYEHEQMKKKVLLFKKFLEWKDRQRTDFAIEDFRLFVSKNHPELLLDNDKAWGGFTTGLVRKGLIHRTGMYRQAVSPKTRGHDVKMYARGAL